MSELFRLLLTKEQIAQNEQFAGKNEKKTYFSYVLQFLPLLMPKSETLPSLFAQLLFLKVQLKKTFLLAQTFTVF